VIGSYARVVPTVVFQGTDYPVVAPINGDLVVQQWMQTDHLASHEHYDASFANPSHIITASPPASHPYIERSWNDSAGHEVQEYWVAAGASHVWTGGEVQVEPLSTRLDQTSYRSSTASTLPRLPSHLKGTCLLSLGLKPQGFTARIDKITDEQEGILLRGMYNQIYLGNVYGSGRTKICQPSSTTDPSRAKERRVRRNDDACRTKWDLHPGDRRLSTSKPNGCGAGRKILLTGRETLHSV